MNRFKYTTALVAGMALACSMSANADDISDYVHAKIGAGATEYARQGDNTWYQLGSQYDLGLSAPAIMIGLTGPLYARESWGVDWLVAYVSLGHVSSQCECTPNDNDYSTATHSVKTPMPYPVPNANFVGNGNAQGIALALEPYFRYRGFRVALDVGLFPYRPAWDVQVTNWQPWPGVPISTTSASTPHAIQWGKMVGVSIERGRFGIAYEHFALPTKNDATHSPAIWKGADVVMLTYKY